MSLHMTELSILAYENKVTFILSAQNRCSAGIRFLDRSIRGPHHSPQRKRRGSRGSSTSSMGNSPLPPGKALFVPCEADHHLTLAQSPVRRPPSLVCRHSTFTSHCLLCEAARQLCKTAPSFSSLGECRVCLFVAELQPCIRYLAQ